MTHDQVDSITVASVTRRVIAAMAPAEYSAVDTYLAAYERDPAMVRHLDGRRWDDSTGFGGLDTTLTPYVVAVVSTVLTILAAELGEAVRAETGDRIRGLVGKLFSRALGPSAPSASRAKVAALTSAQLKQVRAVAYKKARGLRLPESTAATLADAVVGSLAIHDE